MGESAGTRYSRPLCSATQSSSFRVQISSSPTTVPQAVRAADAVA